jgi:ElaB/YqjD/DUF883 family membrane-anchored ribosome-binding protein
MDMEQNESIIGGSLKTLKTVIADKLEQAAETFEAPDASEPEEETCNRQASEWLRRSAAYVREWDVQKADLKLRNRIQAHPGQSILIGLTAGVLVGLWLNRR